MSASSTIALMLKLTGARVARRKQKFCV